MWDKLKQWLFGPEEKEEEKVLEKTTNQEAFYETRKLSKQSRSYYINVPKEWFEKNDIDPEEVEEITMLANSDILIINPNRENEVREKIGKKTFEIYQEERNQT